MLLILVLSAAFGVFGFMALIPQSHQKCSKAKLQNEYELFPTTHKNTGQEKILQISTRARGACGSREVKYQALVENKTDMVTM